MHQDQNHINYSNWVPKKMIVVPFFLALVCIALSFFSAWFMIGVVFFLVIAAYFQVSHYMFSLRHGHIQQQVQELVLGKLDSFTGKPVRILDIGCGNGPLTIAAAARNPQAKVMGVDMWGKNWDYSMKVCEKNARLAGVDKRVAFRQASAETLPYEDGSFDIVLSNLVFHEVRGVKDKRLLVKEALRVLKPGGTFILQDLFRLRSYYGTPKELLETIRSWGVAHVDFIRTGDSNFIPTWVKLPFMLGALAMVVGEK